MHATQSWTLSRFRMTRFVLESLVEWNQFSKKTLIDSLNRFTYRESRFSLSSNQTFHILSWFDLTKVESFCHGIHIYNGSIPGLHQHASAKHSTSSHRQADTLLTLCRINQEISLELLTNRYQRSTHVIGAITRRPLSAANMTLGMPEVALLMCLS